MIWVHRQFWPSASPSSAFSTNNARALAEAGVETHLIVGNGAPDRETSEVLENHYGLSTHPNLHIHRINKLFIGPLSSSKPFYWQAYQRIQKIRKSAPVDSVATRDAGFLPFLSKLKQRHRLKVFYETHNYFMDISSHPDLRENLKSRKKYHEIEKKHLDNMDGLFCLLSPQAELYGKHVDANKIHVVHPGLSKTFEANPDAYEEKKIAYIGGLQEQRDFEVLFQAIHQLKKKEARLLIIGGREAEMERIKNLLQEAKIGERTQITGWIGKPEIRKHLEKVSIGVVPMKDKFYNRYLTSPMKIFDYISRGIPVVAADLPSSREFLDENKDALFYQPGDAASFADALDQLLSDQELWAHLSEGALKKASIMSWSHRAELLKKIVSQTT